jgi:catechol 2,3-dioxygenase-like lactoylglutathione lyase family enzyme
MYSFACRDPEALAAFWSRVLDRPVDPRGARDWVTIGLADEGPTWVFTRSADPPAGPNRLVLDLGGDEAWREHADRVEALGARRVAEHEVDGARWVEFRDPEGNTFRIFAPRPQR